MTKIGSKHGGVWHSRTGADAERKKRGRSAAGRWYGRSRTVSEGWTNHLGCGEDRRHRTPARRCEFTICSATSRSLRIEGICGCAAIPRERLVGRDILTFIPGDVPAELGNFTDTQLESAARLLREFHDATTDCELRGERQIVCHGDASPCNCVFVNGIPAAFIDFDTAHAGERREDVGYAIWLWLDLGNSDLEPTFQARRLARFVEAYGGFALTDALPAVLDAQTELENRPGTPMGVRAWAQTCQDWTKRNRLVLAGIVNAGADSRG